MQPLAAGQNPFGQNFAIGGHHDELRSQGSQRRKGSSSFRVVG